jgi:hypothetical protein
MTACYAVTVEKHQVASYMDWPKEYSKTTQAVRDAAFKLYYVEAITQSVLLPGQVKTAYHGGPLTTGYYLFLFTSRENPKRMGSAQRGIRSNSHGQSVKLLANLPQRKSVSFTPPCVCATARPCSSARG